MTVKALILLYLIIVNLTGFALMWADKRKAIRNAWRIPEARLFLFALIGGSLGCILGMYTFRHKTRHWYFIWGMPAILVLQLAVASFLLFRFF